MHNVTSLTTPWSLTLTDAFQGTVPVGAWGERPLVEVTPLPQGTVVTDLSVPGCVHTDLLGAGLIVDPYLDLNEDTLHWIGRSTWEYSHRFTTEIEPGRVYELAFDGIDTVAEVFLNGTSLGQVANMHRQYRFAVTDVLLAGENELRVVFPSVYEYAEKIVAQYGDRPNVYPDPFQYVRKMACNFGWDWGPTLVTAGLWKEVRLESWSVARIASVRPDVSVGADGRGRVSAVVEIERATGVGTDGAETEQTDTTSSGITLTASCAGGTVTVEVPAGADTVTINLSGLEVSCWWPHDMGGQPLYELNVELNVQPADEVAVLGVVAPESATSSGATSPLDSWTRRVGFRTVELRTDPDADGTEFTIAINGIDTFMRGVNWIPDDCFVATISRERYDRRLTQTRDANVNLVRIWGGGLYETDAFYEECDELGLLVWQDFLFACSAYPEEPLWAEVEAEARDNVTRLMPHPSLILWNGNNENIWGFEDWGWQEPLAGRSWGHGFYFSLLPSVVAEIDPGRPYWPGSPWSGNQSIHPNDPNHANMHSWEVWNRQDYTVYREDRPRFVSEFGFQGPANWATLERAISQRPLTPDSAEMLAHQKADDGNEKLRWGMVPHLPMPSQADAETTMDDWHYLTQLNQAKAVEFGISWFRSLRPRCMGSIVWQINDCWPVSSWAAIDGDGREKPLWFALRAAYAPRFVTVVPLTGAAGTLAEASASGGLKAVVCNDSRELWEGTLVIERVGFDGAVLARQEREVRVSPGSQAGVRLSDDVANPLDAKVELVTARVVPVSGSHGEVAVSHTPVGQTATSVVSSRFLGLFTEDVDAEIPVPELDVVASDTPTGVQLTLTARTLVRSVIVQADRIDPDAVCSDQLLTLLPGESAAIDIATSASASDPRWGSRPVLRSVGDIVAG